MAREVKLPTLGENVTGGDVVEVKVKPGDEVKEGQALLEVEAEKSSVEVPSPFAGRVSQVLVKKGDKVETGQPLVVFDGDGAAAQPPPKPKEENKKEKPAPAKNEKPEPAPTPPARKDTPPAPTKDKPPPAKPAPMVEGEERVVPAGPATRRLAHEWGVNLHQVSGSGPKGRVGQEDVKHFVRQLAAGGARGGPASPPPLPNFEEWGQVEYKPLEGVRRKTAEHMALAWNQIPHVTHHDLADVSELENFRKQQEGKGPKLTVTAFALKALAIALREFPRFNSSLDVAQDQLIVKKYYHVGVAVDTERGLLVPVVRDVDKKSLHEIAEELTDLAERARQKKLTTDGMKGGTFTLSNLGGIGGVGFSPIVNFPEVAILGLSRSRLQPVFKEGQWVPRPLLPLSVSYDHRVIDGADAARFTRRLAELLENPLMMLLHT
jgi:pyruvate dehydrogenase E2 component (dihydrolipoamide acetyltransferase)